MTNTKPAYSPDAYRFNPTLTSSKLGGDWAMFTAVRGSYRLGWGNQSSGHDGLAYTYIHRPDLKYWVTETNAEWRELVNSPYLWVVRACGGNSSAAFMCVEELNAWIRAYNVTLTPRDDTTSQATIGAPESWEPIEIKALTELPMWALHPGEIRQMMTVLTLA